MKVLTEIKCPICGNPLYQVPPFPNVTGDGTYYECACCDYSYITDETRRITKL